MSQPPVVANAVPRRKRLWWLLAIGGGLVLAAAAYLHFYLYLPIGSGPAGPAVSAADFEHVWTERPMLLVGLGDSVTAGLGSSRGKSYFERLIQNPPDEFADMQGRSLSRVLPNLSTLNLAVSGSTSLQRVGRALTSAAVRVDGPFSAT